MNYFERILKKTGWISILESVIFALLGIIIIWRKEEIVKLISCVLGIIFIITGVFKIINYFSNKGKNDIYNFNLIYGLMAIVLGIVTMIYSNTIGTIFRIVIGIWIIYSSLIRVNFAIKLKALNVKFWIHSLVLALIMFGCGLYVVMNSGTIIVTIGIMMIVYSIIDIIENVIFMRNVKDII